MYGSARPEWSARLGVADVIVYNAPRSLHKSQLLRFLPTTGGMAEWQSS